MHMRMNNRVAPEGERDAVEERRRGCR